MSETKVQCPVCSARRPFSDGLEVSALRETLQATMADLERERQRTAIVRAEGIREGLRMAASVKLNEARTHVEVWRLRRREGVDTSVRRSAVRDAMEDVIQFRKMARDIK